jgi:hypothetical protein
MCDGVPSNNFENLELLKMAQDPLAEILQTSKD